MFLNLFRTQTKFTIERFGEKIRALRLENNLTLQQFAESLGYSAHGYISELEAGKKSPTVEFVSSVSRVYRVSIDELLKDELELTLKKLKGR
jgi:transcriptional regulator with XRE-family HTH domain